MASIPFTRSKPPFSFHPTNKGSAFVFRAFQPPAKKEVDTSCALLGGLVLPISCYKSATVSG